MGTKQADPYLSPLRLGISGSSFFKAMPEDLLKTAGAGAKFDTEQNRQMASFMRNMMEAIQGSAVRSLECYHMLSWDAGPVVETILESLEKNPNLELWSVHAPYGAHVDPSLPDPNVRAAAVEACTNTVQIIKQLGARVMVVHPGANVSAPVDRAERLKLSTQTLTEIAEVAAVEGIMMAVETMPKLEVGNTIEELIRIVDNVDRPNVGVCLDTNHVFPASLLPRAIKKLEDRLVSVHVSDHDGGGERHWLPFEGVVDWSTTVKALLEANYKGPLIHEVHGSCTGTCEETVATVENSYIKLAKMIEEHSAATLKLEE